MSTATGFRNGFAAAFFAAVSMLSASEAAPPERDYGYNGCHAQTNRCLAWCIGNRTGDELGKCIANCHTYEDKCYAKRTKAARASDIAPAAPANPAPTSNSDDGPAADSVAPKKKRVAKDGATRRPD